jgi:hypothetical protein
MQVPVNPQSLLAALAERALKKEVKTGFFVATGSESTGIVIKMHVFPFKDDPSTQSISKQEPEEKFVLAEVARGPEPAKQRQGFH